jgi:hypothetical protein
LSISLSLSLCACGSTNQNADRAAPSNLKIEKLKLNASEQELAGSTDFQYFPAGHFGDKTQYNGKKADEFGGAYAVHCRAQKPFSIEVKYPEPGIAKINAMKVMERLLPPGAGEVVEHDDEDVKKMDSPQAAEFFYYKNGPRTELLYAKGSDKNIVQVNIWTKDG